MASAQCLSPKVWVLAILMLGVGVEILLPASCYWLVYRLYLSFGIGPIMGLTLLKCHPLLFSNKKRKMLPSLIQTRFS